MKVVRDERGNHGRVHLKRNRVHIYTHQTLNVCFPFQQSQQLAFRTAKINHLLGPRVLARGEGQWIGDSIHCYHHTPSWGGVPWPPLALCCTFVGREVGKRLVHQRHSHPRAHTQQLPLPSSTAAQAQTSPREIYSLCTHAIRENAQSKYNIISSIIIQGTMIFESENQ